MSINVDNVSRKQSEGVWTSFGGSQFKVAHTSSTKFQRILNRLQAPHRRKIDKGTLDPAISKEILCTAMAEAILLDWKGVVNGKGEEVAYSPEAAIKALMNNEDLREYIQDYSIDLENFRQDLLDEQGKS